MELTIANDIGNSETKMIVNDVMVKQPSVVKRLLSKPNVVESATEKSVLNLLDEMVVNVTSDGIKRNGLYLIGKRANVTAYDNENMNIKVGRKFKHDIPVIMTLAMSAARAVQLSYHHDKELSSTLSVAVRMTSAIPASEYTKENALRLEQRFTKDDHIVIVHVGDKSVTVKLNFKEVNITQEGVPALYAMIDNAHEILGQDGAQELKMLHVDIGDGTTEYIYTDGMNPVNDACSGARRGVGHVTEDAKQLLKEELDDRLDINRQQFMEIVRNDTHNLHDLAVRFMKEAKYTQAQLILEDIHEKYMSKTAGNVDIIIVYGGGSIQFKEELHEELLDFAQEVRCKVIWVSEKYAVDMNVNGMQILNDQILYNESTN